MQVDAATLARMGETAPVLMESVDSETAAPVMRRDPTTDYCVKFSDGLCGIHKEHGDALLSDACHFYPRIQRALGESVLTAMSVSCPEAARLMLEEDSAFEFAPHAPLRASYLLHNYLPEGMSADEALAIHQQFIAMALAPEIRAERAMMRISAVARGLMYQTPKAWAEAMPLYSMLADGRIAAAQSHVTDIPNLAHALEGLVRATRRPHPQLMQSIHRLSDRLGIAFCGDGTFTVSDDAPTRVARLVESASQHNDQLQPLLKRYLAAELSQALFPFSGFGNTLEDRITILGVRFATVKYMLAAHAPMVTREATTLIARIARFLDHLEDPTFSMAIYREVGWNLEGRLRGLVGDTP